MNILNKIVLKQNSILKGACKINQLRLFSA